MPVAAAVAWLPWAWANAAWCFISVACFATSLVFILRNVDLPSTARLWLTCAVLAYAPVHTGLAMGNPSVVACSLVAVAVFLASSKKPICGGLLLGVVHCLKPQLSICGLILFAMWHYWSAFLISLIPPVIAGAVSVLPASSLAEYWQWCDMLLANIAYSFAPGNVNDPSIHNHASELLLNAQTITQLLTENPLTSSAIIWGLVAALIGVYFLLRAAHGASQWRDLGFFSALTLVVTYHRYYDAQMLLLLIPFLVRNWRAERVTVISISACLLLVAFPSQRALAAMLHSAADPWSLLGAIFFRHQPIAVLSADLLLVPWSPQRLTKSSLNA